MKLVYTIIVHTKNTGKHKILKALTQQSGGITLT
jgi:hypothetical protein